MAYPYTFPELPGSPGSYALEDAVQRLLMTHRVNNPRVETPDQSGVRNLRIFLVQVSAEIDATLLAAGVVAPPPVNTPILSILEQYASYGAAAMYESSRYEGDPTIGQSRANYFNGLYDNGLSLLERGDINLIQMGCVDAGWAQQADRRKRFRSGNLDTDRSGNVKAPLFTMQDQF